MSVLKENIIHLTVNFFFHVLWGINVKATHNCSSGPVKKKKKRRKHNRLTGRQTFLSRPDFPFRSSLDLPTSLAQIFSRARSARGRFLCFLRQKRARERELGPTTGTGNEKQRTLRKSTLVIVTCKLLLLKRPTISQVFQFRSVCGIFFL